MILKFRTVTDPGSSERANEDWAGSETGLAVVLDGLSAPQGISGCFHSTPWFVDRLGSRLVELLQQQELSLKKVLSTGIKQVADEHRDTCTLDDVGTPCSTVALVRALPGAKILEALVLADSPVVVDIDGHTEVLVDQSVESVAGAEREAALAAPTGTQAKKEAMFDLVSVQRRLRNVPGGYWVASSDPEAAEHALTAAWPLDRVQRVAAMSDGISCLVEDYHSSSWSKLLDMADNEGVARVVERVRELESQDPKGEKWPRYKRSDDATLAFARLERR